MSPNLSVLGDSVFVSKNDNTDTLITVTQSNSPRVFPPPETGTIHPRTDAPFLLREEVPVDGSLLPPPRNGAHGPSLPEPSLFNMPTSPLLARALTKLQGSDLSEEDYKTLKIALVTPEQAKSARLPSATEGMKLPYFDLQGRVTKFFRVRYLADTRSGFEKLTGEKPIRYGQPTNTVNEVYLPPYLDWAAVAGDPELPVVITEGELKSACTTKHGYATMGLGGVWCFQSNKHNNPLLPVFDEFEWSERTVYICFDSDAALNPDILAAETRLATRLVERGAFVYICRLPAHQEVAKTGLDDFIVLRGAERLQEDVFDPAFEFEASKVLHSLNERVLYVRDPGFVWDRELKLKLTPDTFMRSAFANVHYWESVANKQGTTLVRRPAAKSWIEWEHRAEARGLIFAPGAPDITHEGLLNTWTGWGVKAPVKGDVTPWVSLMDHLFGADHTARKWFEQWCAYPLQHPGYKLATAVLLWGIVHGSGKTLVGHTLMRLYGKHSAEIHDTDLEDNRKEWAADKQFVLGDDIVAKGDRQMMRAIMTMVTQKTVRLNPKFIPSYALPDTINYLYTSNEPDALYMDDGDRRFFVHEVLADKYKNYREYVRWRESTEGIGALWHYLLSIDTSAFDPQAPAPETAGKHEMQELGKSELGAWVRELRNDGPYILDKHGFKGDLISAPELYAIYDPAGAKRTSVNALARELKRAGFKPPATGSKVRLPDGRMRMVYVIKNADKWRKATWSQACEHYAQFLPEQRGAKYAK